MNSRCIDNACHTACAMASNAAVEPDRGRGGDVQGEDLSIGSSARGGDRAAEESIGIRWDTWGGECGLRNGVLRAIEVELDCIADSCFDVVGGEREVSVCV